MELGTSDVMELAKEMADHWPSAIVAQQEVGNFSGGAISPGTIANLSCIGRAPEKIQVGRKTCYRALPLAIWLLKRGNLSQRPGARTQSRRRNRSKKLKSVSDTTDSTPTEFL